MSKKFWLVIVVFLLSLIVSSCVKEDKIMKDYPGINDENHIFKEITVNDIINKIKKEESFYLILGFPECPWCQALMPVLNNVAKEFENVDVYYLNIKEMRDDENHKDHEKYLELEENYFSEALDVEKNRLNAPTFIKVKNGDMKKYHLNTVSTHVMNENNVLPPLTTEEEDELKGILRSFFE